MSVCFIDPLNTFLQLIPARSTHKDRSKLTLATGTRQVYRLIARFEARTLEAVARRREHIRHARAYARARGTCTHAENEPRTVRQPART